MFRHQWHIELDGHTVKCDRDTEVGYNGVAVIEVPNTSDFEVRFAALCSKAVHVMVGICPADIPFQEEFTDEATSEWFERRGAFSLYCKDPDFLAPSGMQLFSPGDQDDGVPLVLSTKGQCPVWSKGDVLSMRWEMGQLGFRFDTGAWLECSAKFASPPDSKKSYLPFIAFFTGTSSSLRIGIDVVRKRGAPLENVVAQQRSLWNNPTFTDAEVVCPDGTRFPVHRAVLSAASPVFLRAFSGSMHEAISCTFEIKTIEATREAVQAMLQFIYTGDLELPCKKHVDAPLSASDDLVPMLSLARQYELNELCTIVANLLVDGISLDNAQRRSQALKLHSDHCGVAIAFDQLFGKLRDSKELLLAAL